MFNPLGVFKKPPPKIESVFVIESQPSLTRAFIYSVEDKFKLSGEGQGGFSVAAEEAQRKAGFRPTRAVVGVGGQNAWCLTTTLRYNRKDMGSPIDEKELQKVLKMLEQTAKMQTEQQLAEFIGDPEEEFVLIDSDQPQFIVDDQPLPFPLQKTGKTLQVSLFTAYSPTEYIGKVKTDCQNSGLDLFALFSLTNSLINELANGERPHFNAVVIEASPEETEVSVCFGGRILGNRVFSLGTTDPKDLWVSGLKTALSDFAGVKKFPDRLILVGDDVKMATLKEVIENYPLTRSLPFGDRPFVETRGDVKRQALMRVAQEILGDSNGN